MNNNKNINWINVVKALSIIAVFFVHCQLYYGVKLDAINVFVYPFYVNAFFFVSGYLLFRKQLSAPIINEKTSTFIMGGGGKILMLNSLFRIAIPSIIFAAIEYIPKNLLRAQAIDLSDCLWETIGGLTYWFTSALVLAQVIIFLMLTTRCRKMLPYWIVSIAIMALGMYMAERHMNFLGLSRDLWQFKHGLYAVAFLTAGGLYWRFEKTIQNVMNAKVVMLMLLIYIVLFTLFGDYIHVLVSTLDVNWIGYIAGCFASMLLIELCRYLPVIKLLTFIGQNSMSFYFMSGALPIVLSLIATRIGETANIYVLFIIWISSMATAFAATYLFNRYMPWLFDLRRINQIHGIGIHSNRSKSQDSKRIH